MTIAILSNTIVTNTAIFEDFETAQQFLADGVWEDADDVQEPPDGFGINDSYIDGEWIKVPEPEPAPEPEPIPNALSDDEIEFVRGLAEGLGGLII
jgi:hypothetical protein